MLRFEIMKTDRNYSYVCCYVCTTPMCCSYSYYICVISCYVIWIWYIAVYHNIVMYTPQLIRSEADIGIVAASSNDIILEVI